MDKDGFGSKVELLNFLDDKAEWLRKEMVRLSAIAGGSHFGGGMSMVDVMVGLFYHGLKLKPGDAKWPERDRFVLSKGHGAICYCPILADLGFFPTEWLEGFNRLDSPFGMHPDMKKIPGVEMSTGSLGHGLSVSVGIALAGRLDAAAWRVFTLMGDGETNEGMVWEAAQAARHFGLGNINAFIDRNGLSMDGPTEQIMSLEPMQQRWESFGWRVYEIDGHDMEQIVDVIDKLPPAAERKPTVVVARTVKGKGIDFMENDPIWHYSGLDREKSMEAIAMIEKNRPARRV